jgi:lysophospholipase L1-like esterase
LSLANNKIVNVIDIFNTLGGEDLTKPEMFADFCHPNDLGMKTIAQKIYQ